MYDATSNQVICICTGSVHDEVIGEYKREDMEERGSGGEVITTEMDVHGSMGSQTN